MSISTIGFSTASNGSDKSTYSPSRNPNIGVTYGTNYEGIIRNQAIGGEVYTVERFGKRRYYTMTFSFLDSTDEGKLQALIDQADGRKNSFYYSPDDFSTSVLVRFDQDTFAFEEVANGATSITFTLIEQI